MKSLILILSLFSAIIIGCKSDEVQATNSLEGSWQITSVVTTMGTFNGSTFISEENVKETGELGTFDFTENTVAFSFIQNKEVVVGNETWEFKTEKVNAGFTRVNKHTLTIGNAYLFDVTFEDATKNAEKNAKTITFVKAPTTQKPYGISLLLKKN